MWFKYLIVAVVFGAYFTLSGTAGAQTTHEILGTADNTWSWKNMESSAATAGKPDGRLTIKVKNGDTVVFKVAGGRHGVLFESGADEQANGVWAVAGGSKLEPAKSLGKAYDPKKAVATAPAGKGTTVLTITIKDLKKGPQNGILIGCNPHSKSDDGKDVEMLGVIILDAD